MAMLGGLADAALSRLPSSEGEGGDEEEAADTMAWTDAANDVWAAIQGKNRTEFRDALRSAIEVGMNSAPGEDEE